MFYVEYTILISYDGYDLVKVSALYQNYSTNKINIYNIDALYLDLTLPNQSKVNRLTFSVSGVHYNDVYNCGHLDISGALDIIEVVSGCYSKKSLDI